MTWDQHLMDSEPLQIMYLLVRRAFYVLDTVICDKAMFLYLYHSSAANGQSSSRWMEHCPGDQYSRAVQVGQRACCITCAINCSPIEQWSSHRGLVEQCRWTIQLVWLVNSWSIRTRFIMWTKWTKRYIMIGCSMLCWSPAVLSKKKWCSLYQMLYT